MDNLENKKGSKKGRPKKNELLIYEWVCTHCQKDVRRTFLSDADAKKNVLLQNECCAECYLTKAEQPT